MQIHGELATIPGYVDAVERENKIRNAAMLNLNARICGIEVRQMTLRHWLILDGIDSPLLNGGLPDPDKKDIEKFLWVLSPKFTPHQSRAKSWFIYRAGKIPYGQAVVECRRFVEDTFQDEPPSTADPKTKGEWKPPQFSFAASVINALCSTLHWTRGEVMDAPLKESFQHMKIEDMRASHMRGEKFTDYNPSDRIKWRHIRKIRAERQAAKLSSRQN